MGRIPHREEYGPDATMVGSSLGTLPISLMATNLLRFFSLLQSILQPIFSLRIIHFIEVLIALCTYWSQMAT